MFTLDQIHSAHAKVQSGADFPHYIQDLKDLGVRSYRIFVLDGHAQYQGDDNYTITSPATYQALDINSTTNKEEFLINLKLHQQGGSDYPTFCQHAAQAGIAYWIMDLQTMECIYCDRADNPVLVETIPSV